MTTGVSMTIFDDLRGNKLFADLRPLPASDRASIANAFPGIPKDYLDFLAEIGTGTLKDAAFVIYSAPIFPSDIYDPVAAKQLTGLLIIGDDFQGYCVAFDAAHDWSIVEINPIDKSLDIVANTFRDFVHTELLSADGAATPGDADGGGED